MQPRGYINFTEPCSGRAVVLPTFLELAAQCPSWTTVTPHTWDHQDSCPCGTGLPNFGMSRLQGDTVAWYVQVLSVSHETIGWGHGRHAGGPGSTMGPLALQRQPSFRTTAETLLRAGLILVMTRISSGLQWVILPRNLKSEMAVIYPNSALSKAGLDFREKIFPEPAAGSGSRY